MGVRGTHTMEEPWWSGSNYAAGANCYKFEIISK